MASLKSLEILDLGENSIGDVTSLASLANLQTLNLQANAVKDVSGLEGLKSLKVLMLTGNPLDWNAVASLSAKITGCKILFEALPVEPGLKD